MLMLATVHPAALTVPSPDPGLMELIYLRRSGPPSARSRPAGKVSATQLIAVTVVSCVVDQLIRPSAFIAACTAGRWAMRALYSASTGQGDRSTLTSLLQPRMVNR